MARLTASDFTLYNDLFNRLDNIADTYITTVAADVIASITPVATVSGIIVIMMYGIMLMRGSVETPLIDATFRALKLMIVTGLALNIGIYQEYIGDFFIDAPSAMASVLVGNAGTESASSDAITEFTVSAYNLGDKVWQQGSAISFNFGPLLLAVIVWAFAIALGAYIAFLFLLGKIATAVLLAIGPIFILLSVFESGKRFAEMWLQQLCNFGLIVVLSSACMSFFLVTITNTTEQSLSAIKVPNSEVFYFVAFALIDVLILRQVMPIASGLAGGMALSTQGAFGAASSALGRAIGATTKKFSPGNISESYRRNQRNVATLQRMASDFKQSQGQTLARMAGGSIGSAAATAYKRKFEPG
jgi:type IV secretion system protein VirB6